MNQRRLAEDGIAGTSLLSFAEVVQSYRYFGRQCHPAMLRTGIPKNWKTMPIFLDATCGIS